MAVASGQIDLYAVLQVHRSVHPLVIRAAYRALGAIVPPLD